MSRPWMPFYVADYLRDTRKLTPAEHGAYLLLIMEYWTAGALPDDDQKLARVVGMTTGEWRKAKPSVQAFFTEGWHHGRIEVEIGKAEAKHERRSEAGKRGGIAKANAKQCPSNASGNALASSSQPQSQPEKKERKETRASALDAPWVEADRERFWAEFPNKIGKAAALKAFEKASQKTTPDVLFPALDRYAKKTDDRPFCNPSTWLNQERWLDQPAATNGNGISPNRTAQASGSTPTRDATVIAGMAGALERRRAARAADDPGRQEFREERGSGAAGRPDAEPGTAAGNPDPHGQFTFVPKANTG